MWGWSSQGFLWHSRSFNFIELGASICRIVRSGFIFILHDRRFFIIISSFSFSTFIQRFGWVVCVGPFSTLDTYFLFWKFYLLIGEQWVFELRWRSLNVRNIYRKNSKKRIYYQGMAFKNDSDMWMVIQGEISGLY